MNTHRQWAELLRAVSEPAAASASDELLSRALELGRDVAADTLGCSVTTIDGDRYHTPVFSGALARDLDRAQYDSGGGPCMAAARERQRHHFDAQTDGDRFPGFAKAAAAGGVRSSISLPLSGPELPSALNIYASSRYAFDAERPRAVADLLARCVSALMSPARPPAPAATERLKAAQARAALLADAQASVMAARSLSRPAALSLLIRRSRAERRSIFEIARELVEADLTEVTR